MLSPAQTPLPPPSSATAAAATTSSSSSPPSPSKHTPLNPRYILQNSRALNFARTSLSVLAGGVAGILGLTSIYGFLFYFVVSAILGVYYLFHEARSGGAMHFVGKQQVVTAYVFEHLFTYILMWTLVYGCVHVY